MQKYQDKVELFKNEIVIKFENKTKTCNEVRPLIISVPKNRKFFRNNRGYYQKFYGKR